MWSRLVLPLASLLALPLLVVGCRGYYPTWHYVPGTEIHQLHVPSSDGKETPATIAVAARLVGILRPAAGVPRRLHVHFDVDNRGTTPATFNPMDVRARPAGADPLAPESGSEFTIAPGEQRGAEVYFPLPEPATLPNASLTEIEVSWTIGVEGRQLTSRATFHRASYWRDDPYPYGYDPYWYDRPYYHGYGYGYGPRWYGGFTFVHCD